MTLKTWTVRFLWLSSAFLYALPILFGAYGMWWAPFLFPLPFLYGAMHHKITYCAGWLWAFVANLFGLGGVLIGITQLAEGSWWEIIIPAIITLLYSSLFGIIMVAAARFIIYIQLSKNKYCNTILAWSCALWLYITIMDTLCLWPFDVREGCSFLNPLVFLALYPTLLRLLPIIGKGIFLALVIAPSAFILLYATTKKWWAFIGLIFITLFWILSAVLPLPSSIAPEWLNRVTVVRMVFKRTPHLTLMAKSAQKLFADVIQKHPQTDVIIMPEAALYCDHVSDKDITECWGKQCIGKPVHLILGAFRWEGKLYRNTLFWIHDGQLKQLFDKRHAMVITERIPSILQWDLINKLYFQHCYPITASTNSRPLLALNDSIKFVPYICSELFFNQTIDDDYAVHPIVALCNDRWTTKNMKYAMLINAQFKALLWNRAIVYVSFAHTYYIHANGHLTALQSYQI